MHFSWKQDSKTLIMVVIASVIMAVNINTFVLTGGLYPGGVTGLTLLIQRFGEAFFGVMQLKWSSWFRKYPQKK